VSDTEISILDRCTGRQLKELLALASTGTKGSRNWLLEMGDVEQLEQLEHLLTEMCTGTGHSGSALLQAARSPDTSLEFLVVIKSTAKRLAVAAETPAQKAAATLLYHLSLASALGNHAQNISSNDPAERLPLYKDLAAELSDDQLAAIFEKAIARLSSGSD
jgi:hypothetical protein